MQLQAPSLQLPQAPWELGPPSPAPCTQAASKPAMQVHRLAFNWPSTIAVLSLEAPASLKDAPSGNHDSQACGSSPSLHDLV